MNKVLWTIQILLVFVFLVPGAMKLTLPREKLAAKQQWIQNSPLSMVRLLGLAEVLGAAGLILPALTKIVPVLTPLAASGLALLMLGAIVIQLKANEVCKSVIPVATLLLLIVVAWGRFGPYRIS